MRIPEFAPRGIGVDVVSLLRVEDFFVRHRDSLDKILTSGEREQVERSEYPSRMLARFFSGKEAVFKSLDLDWLGIEGFRMIEIRLPASGEEFGRAALSGTMKEKTANRLSTWKLTFTEIDGFVVAEAVAF